MPKRSYHQFCPVAYALDVVGDRWTLLIVRELSYGPRRFVDILRGLPGIGTNLLSDRLLMMTHEGVISKAKSLAPSSGFVYRLTESGEGLQTVIKALALWGASRLSSADAGDHLGFVPAMSALSFLYKSETSYDGKMSCEIRTGEGIFHIVVDRRGIHIEQGEIDNPDLVIETAPRALVVLLGRPGNAAMAIRQRDLNIIHGSKRQLESLLGRFRPAV